MIRCKACLEEDGKSKKFERINWSHLKYKHGMTLDEYKDKYPDASISSDEWREKVSQTTEKRWDNPEYKKRLRESQKEAQNRPEVSKKRSRSLKEYYKNHDRDEDVRERISESVEEWWQRLEQNGEKEKLTAKISNGTKQAMTKKDVRDSISDSITKKYQNSEYRSKMNCYTEDEKEYIRRNWKDMTDKEIAKNIGRSEGSVGKKRSDMGLDKAPNRKEWTADEEQFVLDNWKDMSDKEMAKELNRTEGSISYKRKDLGLVCSREMINRHISKGIDSENRSRVIKELWQDPEYRRKVVEERKKRWQDPEFIERWKEGVCRKPSGLELQFIALRNRNDLPLKYTGDFSFWIGNPPRNPDFINKDRKKVIEINGDYWHTEEEFEDRKEHFKEYGWQCLGIWQHELDQKSDKEIISKVRDFLGLGAIQQYKDMDNVFG